MRAADGLSVAGQRAAARERHRARRRAERRRETLDVADLPPEVQATPQATATPFVDFPDDGLDMPAYLAAIEKDLIQRALDRTRGNRNRAADLLGIKRTTLVEKLRRLGPE